MFDKHKLLLEIRQKRHYLQKRLKETNDTIERKVIAFSISNYIQMEYNLSKLNFFVNEIGKVYLKRDFMLEKSVPILKTLKLKWDYYFQDLDYANTLMSILSEKNKFILPNTIDINNNELIDITESFYEEYFDAEIKENGINLVRDSNIVFLSFDGLLAGAIGRSYADPYFGDIYSFIKRTNKDIDLLVIPHEIMHGINFLINKENLFNSVVETDEVSTNSIEFIFCDYIGEKYSDIGQGLKKALLCLIGNNAFNLKTNLNNDPKNIDNIISFLMLEAKIIGYGIYQIYKEDRKKGEEKLVEFANHNFSRDMIPDYSSLGFSKEVILSLARKIVVEREELLKEKQLIENKKSL